MTDSSFLNMMQDLGDRLLKTEPIHTGSVHATDTSGNPLMATYELLDEVLVLGDIPQYPDVLAERMTPHLNHAWAEEHFLERVSGVPWNPPPSHERWPWTKYNGRHQDAANKFSHTYPERMWPQHAGHDEGNCSRLPGRDRDYCSYGEHRGIRMQYGDLNDLVGLLVRDPMTRQAFLPIWFPEDTGAVAGQRVPCTLGYHFMIREGKLSCRYYLRSCDLVRHFADDVYLAARLMQWVSHQWMEQTTFRAMDAHPEITNWAGTPLPLGNLTLYISSLHAFIGDKYALELMKGTRV